MKIGLPADEFAAVRGTGHGTESRVEEKENDSGRGVAVVGPAFGFVPGKAIAIENNKNETGTFAPSVD
jgi:hypothetical protein